MTCTVLTWNLGGRQTHSLAEYGAGEKAARCVACVLAERADVVALQESPLDALPGYVLAGSTTTHGDGPTQLFVSTAHAVVRTWSVETSAFPVALVRLADGRRVAAASCHFAPGAGGAKARGRQAALARSALVGTEHPAVLLGDLNMREAEAVDGMRDAFVDLGAPRDVRFTWDGYANPFHADGFKFRCRFDRVYTSGCVCTRLSLVGAGSRSCLSDHYGLLAHVSLNTN